MDSEQVKSNIATFFRYTCTAIVVAINIVAAIALVVSAYAGTFNPVEHPIMGVIPMLLPITAIVMLLLFFIDLIAWRRTAIFAAFTILICILPILQVFPVHFSQHEPRNQEEQARAFHLLTMNVTNFSDLTGVYPDSINPTMSYIIRSGADVVCVQEVDAYVPMKSRCIKQEQIDSLATIYPYQVLQNQLMIFSKTPVTPLDVHLDLQPTHDSGTLSAYRVNIHEQPITIFNAHLRSFGLNDEDKEVLKGLRHYNKERIDEARLSVLSKLADAAVSRSYQADRLVQFIKHFGGTNVIVVGDFNDVPTCYTMRQLSEQQLKDVHAEIGLGYKNTYYYNRFYFTIDHIMYRGNMTPINLVRDKLPMSDHYPLLATFLLN